METETKEVCSIVDIGIEMTGEDSPKYIEAFNDYLKSFSKPEKDGKCINCGSVLGGLLGSFVYGIAWGEGMCSSCGWPARALHDPKIDNKSMFNIPIQYVLCYHPGCVEIKQEEKTDGE